MWLLFQRGTAKKKWGKQSVLVRPPLGNYLTWNWNFQPGLRFRTFFEKELAVYVSVNVASFRAPPYKAIVFLPWVTSLRTLKTRVCLLVCMQQHLPRQRLRRERQQGDRSVVQAWGARWLGARLRWLGLRINTLLEYDTHVTIYSTLPAVLYVGLRHWASTGMP